MICERLRDLIHHALSYFLMNGLAQCSQHKRGSNENKLIKFAPMGEFIKALCHILRKAFLADAMPVRLLKTALVGHSGIVMPAWLIRTLFSRGRIVLLHFTDDFEIGILRIPLIAQKQRHFPICAQYPDSVLQPLTCHDFSPWIAV